jgi:hypothetical protein
VPLGDEEREPVGRVGSHQEGVAGRVSVTEVARPAAQEAVDALHDLFDWDQQPPAVGQLTDPLAGVPHGLP